MLKWSCRSIPIEKSIVVLFLGASIPLFEAY